MGSWSSLGQSSYFGLFLLACYLCSLGILLHLTFGFVRTAATKLPIPRGKTVDPDLFPGDITPKLYSFDGMGRKIWKLVVIGALWVLVLALWLATLEYTYLVGIPWFGWGIADDQTILIAHVALVAVLAVLLAIRAYTYANRFPQVEEATVDPA